MESVEHPSEPTDQQISAAVEAFRLLGDGARLRMLWALSDGRELDVTSLAQVARLSQPATSQHVAKLRMSGAVDLRREGRRSLYRIRGVHLRRVIAEALFHADHAITGKPPHD